MVDVGIVSVYTACILKDDVFCGPSMLFTNVVNPRSHVAGKDEYKSTVVRQGASWGANCTIVCGTTIGRYATIGAGSVLTRDIPDYVLAYKTGHGRAAGCAPGALGWNFNPVMARRRASVPRVARVCEEKTIR